MKVKIRSLEDNELIVFDNVNLIHIDYTSIHGSGYRLYLDNDISCLIDFKRFEIVAVEP